MTYESKKPFKCEICDYSYAQSTTLKRHHESVHEKTKLFKCEICDYSCAQSITLRRHHEAVHEGTLTKLVHYYMLIKNIIIFIFMKKRIWRISTFKSLEAILYKDTRQPVCNSVTDFYFSAQKFNLPYFLK